MPIALTKNASRKFLEIMEKEGLDPSEDAVRLAIKGGGCAGFEYDISFDKVGNIGEFDKEFEFDDIHVLVDAKSYFYINGIEVDWHETLMEQRFIFHNPVATKSCGCGTSFAV